MSDNFFRQVKASANRVLVVNYDGIAAFGTNHSHRKRYSDIVDLLHCIAMSCRTRLIMVSGRPSDELAPLLLMYSTPEIWGTHGLERIMPDGRRDDIPVSEDALRTLLQAEFALDNEGFGALMDVSLAGVSVHWPERASAEIHNLKTKAYRILGPFASLPNIELSESESGIELRLSAANKEDAIRALLGDLNATVPLAYLGFDATDNCVFRLLNGKGLGVHIGPRPSDAADVSVNLKELTSFLTGWIVASGGLH